MKKVIILQRIIPQYRVEFFTKLYNELKKMNINLKVIHSTKTLQNDDIFYYQFPTFEKNIRQLANEKVIVSLGLYKYFKEYKPNLILTEDISNLPNGLIVAIYCRYNKCKYGIIGLGQVLGKNRRSILKRILKLPIDFFRLNASFFIAYSSIGAQYYLSSYNKPAISWNNSVTNIQDINFNNIIRKYKDNTLNVLFIGRIEKFKKLDLLLEALNELYLNIVLNVIGDGSELKFLKLRYKNVRYKINWLGKIVNTKEKEKYFKAAHLGVMPGSGGLVIQEMQSYAIPVIASYSDGTEVDLVKNINPELFIEKMNKENLKKTIKYFYDLDIESKIKMAKNSYQIIKNKYNLDSMIDITVKTVKEKI